MFHVYLRICILLLMGCMFFRCLLGQIVKVSVSLFIFYLVLLSIIETELLKSQLVLLNYLFLPLNLSVLLHAFGSPVVGCIYVFFWDSHYIYVVHLMVSHGSLRLCSFSYVPQIESSQLI